MASILIRNLDPEVKEALKSRAKRNGRSMEAEAREILIIATKPSGIGKAFIELGSRLANDEPFVLPERNEYPRGADFG